MTILRSLAYSVVPLLLWLIWSNSTLTAENQRLRHQVGAHEQSTATLREGQCPAVVEPVVKQPAPDPQEDNDADADAETEAFSAIRTATLFGAVGVVVAVMYVIHSIDLLPESLHNLIINAVGLPEKSPHPLSKQVSYKLDCWFSSNPYSRVLTLFYLSVMLVLMGGMFLFSVSTTGLADSLWETLAGVGIDWTFASATEEGAHSISGFLTRLIAIASSLGGMFITALLLGIVSEAVGEKLEHFKKGKSEVLEVNHTVILGWSDKLLPIIEQISLANESEGGGTIVLLSEKPKEEQEEILEEFEYNPHGTKVICRHGNAIISADLQKINTNLARNIIVVADESLSPDQADARSLRIILSLVGLQMGKQPVGHVVMEICDIDNEPLVKMVGNDWVETVVSHDVIGRLMIQCARQPGLATVWNSILGFHGNEFYLSEWNSLEGKSFGDIFLRFPDAVPCGILNRYGHTLINPADDVMFQPGDKLLVLAEDNDSYQPADTIPKVNVAQIPKFFEVQNTEKVLFCGWRRDMDDIVQVLDDFVAKASVLYIFCEVPVEIQKERLLFRRARQGRDPELKNLTVVHVQGMLHCRRDLSSLPMKEFTSAVILAEESHDTRTEDKDSQALATLLLLRDLQLRGKKSRRASSAGAPDKARLSTVDVWSQEIQEVCDCVVISEILDSRTRSLVQETGISDYVLSNELISMTLAMVAESSEINSVLESLFEEAGSELYLRPSRRYAKEGEELSFFDMMARGRLIGGELHEIVVGYRPAGGGIMLNPEDKHCKRKWSKDDELIVLADE